VVTIKESMPLGGGQRRRRGERPAFGGDGPAPRGIFFPLFQPMLRMYGNPAIRQQGFQGSRVARGDGRGQLGGHNTELLTNGENPGNLRARRDWHGWLFPVCRTM
jgi:hypothetical protein